ncbi:MAG: bifunctional phosphopantothenoylcysteine decarboxylase/phosphopantothenate--cysteine ligase CoaBC [Candidatus Saganbacteria bacterium]|nr:bifunctional phosphopantothenoylcysteine decarboxylase/phosphopantothenate--cysteine ligase CoaBC [Candidatus Saganbacteria bacterium]
MLNGKTIILGVTGCIAAYKSCEILRELKKLGADVFAVMTKEAEKFVGPLTFRTLSGNPVITNLFSEELSDQPVPHISLTDKASLLIVAPATANIIGKVAAGIADDALSTMIMACKSPVIFVPAMNTKMWENPVVRENIAKLKKLGYIFIEPEVGELACGDVGAGRLAGVDKIMSTMCEVLGLPAGKAGSRLDLSGVNILVTAGPTREAIDPVRFLSNRSSGKMGYAVARAALDRGANVTLISGPAQIEPPEGAKVIKVESTEEMRNWVIGSLDDCDILIMAAAISDYRPAKRSKEKIKKKQELILELKENPDILKELGTQNTEHRTQVLVGFAAETENLIENAKKKLIEKGEVAHKILDKVKTYSIMKKLASQLS